MNVVIIAVGGIAMCFLLVQLVVIARMGALRRRTRKEENQLHEDEVELENAVRYKERLERQLGELTSDSEVARCKSGIARLEVSTNEPRCRIEERQKKIKLLFEKIEKLKKWSIFHKK